MEIQELKSTVETLGKAFNEFRETHSKAAKDGDVLIQEKIDKLAAEVARKYELAQKGLDEIDAKLNRPVTNTKDAQEKEIEYARDFKRTQLLIRKQMPVNGEYNPDIDEYRQYGKGFNAFLRRDEKMLDQAEYKFLSVGSDPDGGYLVTPQISSRIQTVVYESSPMRQIATVERISTDSLEIPVDIGEADAGWVSETGTRSETNTPTFAKQTITAHELYAMPKATLKIIEDAAIDLERWLALKVAQKFSRVENTAFISGDGVGKPRGLLTYPAGTSWGQIEQIVSGSATVLTADALIDMVASLKEPYLPNASWLFRRATVASVMKLKANNEYIFQPIFRDGLNASPLLGYPVHFAADIPAVGTLNNLAVVFGDFRMGYTIVDRVGISVLRDPYTQKGFVLYYTRERVGGDVTNFEAFKIMKIST